MQNDNSKQDHPGQEHYMYEQPYKRQVWFYFIHRTTWPGYAGTITNLQIVLNTPKNPYLNQATQKSTCQNFPTPKKSQNRKFQTPKNP